LTKAYPLAWPAGRPRTPSDKRKRARFARKEGVYRDGARVSERTRELTVAVALSRLQDEIDRIGARLPVISSNVETRLDGLPRSGREPEDPGVALYFQLAGKPHCMPCDTYDRVADNIAAIAAHIEATRAIERHGVASLSEMFAGFAALPPPGPVFPRSWRDVFGFGTGPASLSDVEDRYRAMAQEAHPDKGGSHQRMAELNAAREAARRELA
jgi:hypothetical protein